MRMVWRLFGCFEIVSPEKTVVSCRTNRSFMPRKLFETAEYLIKNKRGVQQKCCPPLFALSLYYCVYSTWNFLLTFNKLQLNVTTLVVSWRIVR